MPSVVRISSALYKRLESHAKGFDTPASVIERILNDYESRAGISTATEGAEAQQNKPTRKPQLVFIPSEEVFRKNLLEAKVARVELDLLGGVVEVKTWNAGRFSETSSLRGNLWSGFLRGWAEKGICKATFSVPSI